MTEQEKIAAIDQWTADMRTFRGRIKMIGNGLAESEYPKLDAELAELMSRIDGLVRGA